LHWPCSPFYLQKLAPTSWTCSGCSVGVVCLWTKCYIACLFWKVVLFIMVDRHNCFGGTILDLTLSSSVDTCTNILETAGFLLVLVPIYHNTWCQILHECNLTNIMFPQFSSFRCGSSGGDGSSNGWRNIIVGCLVLFISVFRLLT
jgi:hypothetical protein